MGIIMGTTEITAGHLASLRAGARFLYPALRTPNSELKSMVKTEAQGIVLLNPTWTVRQ